MSVLGLPAWRNQGEHKPSQNKIVSTTVSAFVPSLSLSAPMCPCVQSREHVSLPHTSFPGASQWWADGDHQEPQAKQHPRAAKGAHQGRSLVPLPCQRRALLEASAHNWGDSEGLDIRLLLFYKIFRTVSSYENSYLEKRVSNADEIFASLLLDCASAHCDTVQKEWLLRKSYKFHLHGSKIRPWRLENQSTDE